MRTFKEWTLASLDKTFGLKQKRTMSTLETWLSDPAAQALAAMLVAQELNEHHAPVYGCYIKESFWYFMVLRERAYCISEPYVATRDDIFEIFRILKVLKRIIIDLTAPA
ncbi:MAG: hypothetical protein GY801_18250 [bacterium]|nr:hypothetical protein [bacterium]